MSEQMSPEERAEVAARDLADRGLSVTARAVRSEARVSMAVAVKVARAWQAAAAEESGVEVPSVPDDVRGRLDAIWADAFRAAVALVTPERDHFKARVEELEQEVEALAGEVVEVEAARDEQAASWAQAVAERDEAIEARDAIEIRATRAEDRVAAIEAERDRLAGQVQQMIERLPMPAKGKQKTD